MNSLLLVMALVSAEPLQERVAFANPQGMLLDFTATWCGPCQQMAPIISRLERQGYPVRKVDIDQEKALAQQYGIATIPCFVLVVNGREVNRIVGQTSEAQLRRLLAQIPNEAPVAATPPRTPAQPVSHGELAENDSKPPKKKGLFPGLFSGEREPKPAAPSTENATIRGKDEDPRPDAPLGPTKDPMVASTRIKVRDPKGVNFGTGSIIVSKPGRTLILTCGHLFRELKADSTIEVDVFEGKTVRKYIAKLVEFDLTSDVGLISIPTDNTLPVVTVAAMNAPLALGDRLYSIGCGGGENPSKMAARITNLNKYKGPDNIECTGLPIPGRSGGGLFNGEGEIVGICFAADETDQRGLYTGLKPIYTLLQKAKVLPSRSALESDSEPELGAVDDAFAGAAPPKNRATGTEESIEFGGAELDAGVETNPIATVEVEPHDAAGELPDFNALGDAEVVCIIRPVDPKAGSRIVILNRASPRFVRYLQGEFKSQPKPTSARFPFDPTMNLAGNLKAKAAQQAKADAVPPGYQRYVRSKESR